MPNIFCQRENDSKQRIILGARDFRTMSIIMLRKQHTNRMTPMRNRSRKPHNSDIQNIPELSTIPMRIRLTINKVDVIKNILTKEK